MTRARPGGSAPAPSGAARTGWMSRGLCASAPDPDLWFPEVGQQARAAVAVCARCPVLRECLDHALSLPRNPAGVWGGTTEVERRELRARSATARAAARRGARRGRAA